MHVVGSHRSIIDDAPALKAAEVGISVEGAVEDAKESADMSLVEACLAVLGESVIAGRKPIGHITKELNNER